MRISGQVREDAILICAIAASNREFTEDYFRVAKELWDTGIPMDPLLVAMEAWNYVDDSCKDSYSCRDAEAEALLRNGWSPKGSFADFRERWL